MSGVQLSFRLLVFMTSILAIAAGCAHQSDDPAARPTASLSGPAKDPSEAPPARSAARDVPIDVSEGVILRPGVDGRLPVTVRWTYQGAAPETFAVDRRRKLLYLDDELATALDLRNGSIVWKVGSPPHSVLGGGLASDGGDVIGPSGQGRVRFFAPYNFDLTIDPQTGTRTAFRYAPGAVSDGLRSFPRPRPRDPSVKVALDRVVARSSDGRVAWRIDVREPMFGEARPIAVPGGVALLLSTGRVVVLDSGRPK